VAAAPVKARRGGAKGPRRPASVRLKELQGKYHKYKEESSTKLAEMERKIATLQAAVAKEASAADVRKKYLDKTADEIEMEYQEALRKVHELKKIRG
jgi:hypothetical protein